MMYVTKRKKTLLKKSAYMSILILVLAGALYAFDLNEKTLYYAAKHAPKSYFLLAHKDIERIFYTEDQRGLAGISGLVIAQFNEHTTESSASPEEYARSIPVLTYHGIVDDFDGANVMRKDFMDQMYFLKEQGYDTVTLEDFAAFIQGEKSLPPKSFLLTFDDGRKDSYYPVDPILKALDYNAVIFVITSFSLADETEKESTYYLSEEELKKMMNSGRWEVQAHTGEGHEVYPIDQEGHLGHFYSNKLWLEEEQRLENDEEFRARIAQDFHRAKEDLQNKLNVNAIAFAYPFGDFGQETLNNPNATAVIDEEVKKVYTLAFYQPWPGKGHIFNYPNNDHLMKRIEVQYDWTPENLLAVLDAGKNKQLPFSDDFTNYTGWITPWGKATLEENGLLLSPAIGKTGALVFLDGSALWTDYTYTATIDVLQGSSVTLLAYYQDQYHYLECLFDDNGARINLMQDKIKKLAETTIIPQNVKAMHTFGMQIKDNQILCYQDGKIVLSTKRDEIRKMNGGIGIKIWDQKMENSQALVTEIFAESAKKNTKV